MDSDNDSYRFPKCQTHAYTMFENDCSENSTQKLLTKYSTKENNKHVICRPRSVRIGKNCALGLEYGPRPQAEGRTQDRRQITYIYDSIHLIHKWPPTWDERAAKHGIEAFWDKTSRSSK